MSGLGVMLVEKSECGRGVPQVRSGRGVSPERGRSGVSQERSGRFV